MRYYNIICVILLLPILLPGFAIGLILNSIVIAFKGGWRAASAILE